MWKTKTTNKNIERNIKKCWIELCILWFRSDLIELFVLNFSIILPEVKSRLFFLTLHHKEIIYWRTLKLNTIKIFFFILFNVWWCNTIKSTTFFRCFCFNTNWLDKFIKIFWLIQLNGWMKTWFLPFNNRKLNKYQIHWIFVLFALVLDFVIRGVSLYEKQKQKKKTIFYRNYW